MRVELLLDDAALGRVMYEMHSRFDTYTRPDIERMSGLNGYSVADSINLNLLKVKS